MEPVQMNMPALKVDNASPLPKPPATVVSLAINPPPRASRIASRLGEMAARVVPPIIVVALFLLIWQQLCGRPASSLPPPSRVLADTWELIVDPFYDRGGIDKGL